MKPKNLAGYEATYKFLSQESYDGGMEAYYDFLPLLIALLRKESGMPGGERCNQLAYFLNDEQRRLLQDLATPANRLDDAAIANEISEEMYHAQKNQRFGTTNPEVMNLSFWQFMIRTGWNAYRARKQYDSVYRQHQTLMERKAADEEVSEEEETSCYNYGAPIWSFERFGTSHTRLPNGRTLLIAGEHEDYYDVDFCIYNDVIVIDREMRITIYGYPKEVFPPTDFHTATLAGESKVYIIGSVGYMGEREVGVTPVYSLDTQTMQIEAVATNGKSPGWISNHKAEYDTATNAIKISGGEIFTGKRGEKSFKENPYNYWLDLTTLTWSRKQPPVIQKET
jgi:hypothetical protein